ncbi:YXWGXW repeat-containing protein [Microvirga zambiensis]|uniref:YXWGXW repeat-containing protein n=1 Tax=Microvirga zambiensis TaxID=1402137 RepID=UPI00192019E3|nr:YXWGXW repeat-containing protein [Microvirga zambiensis]
MITRRILLNWLVGAAAAIPLGTVGSTNADAQPRRESRPPRPTRPGGPPPPRRRERRPPHRPGFVWVPGRWVWSSRRGRWVWTSGHWVRRRGRW